MILLGGDKRRLLVLGVTGTKEPVWALHVFSVIKLHADFCIHTSWQAEVLQAVDSFWRRVSDVDQTLVDAHFERFTAGFVDVR